MQVQTIAASILIALSLVACGKDSDKKGSSTSPGPNPDGQFFPEDQFGGIDDGFRDPEECHSQSDCGTNSNRPRLTIVSFRSWRYTNANQGRVGAEGESCTESLVSSSDGVNIRLRKMEARTESDRSGAAARCLMQAEVRYPKGWSFAIRRVSLQVDTNLRSGATAAFQGSYADVGRTSFELGRSINRSGSTSTLIEKVLSSNDYAWSPCNGESSLSFNTVLKLQRGGSSNSDVNNLGDIEVSQERPYKVEIIWNECR